MHYPPSDLPFYKSNESIRTFTGERPGDLPCEPVSLSHVPRLISDMTWIEAWYQLAASMVPGSSRPQPAAYPRPRRYDLTSRRLVYVQSL